MAPVCTLPHPPSPLIPMHTSHVVHPHTLACLAHNLAHAQLFPCARSGHCPFSNPSKWDTACASQGSQSLLRWFPFPTSLQQPLLGLSSTGSLGVLGHAQMWSLMVALNSLSGGVQTIKRALCLYMETTKEPDTCCVSLSLSNQRLPVQK